MKSTKKILLAAGIIFQLSASLYADNWSDAAAAFGGAAAVYNNRGTMAWPNALAIAKQVGTAEAMSIGLYMSNGNPAVLANKFQGAKSQAVVEAALTVSAPDNRSNPVVVNQTPSNPQTPAANSSWFNWFGGSSATCDNDVQAAQVAQQKADALKAAENQAALQSIAASSATGANLYNGYVDLILGSLQQAISGIADPEVQMQVKEYAQNKVSSMKITAQNSSRVLGKISSKKESKKNKKSRK